MEPKKLSVSQVMILSSIYSGKSKISDIAKEIDITRQGVIYHIRTLREKGFLDNDSNITNEGFEALYESISDLRNYLTESINRMDMVSIWEAVSDDSIDAGSRVFLYMKEGYLHATRTEMKAATGKAINSVTKGSLLLVSEISGMVKMSVGTLKIIVIKNSQEIEGRYKEHSYDASDDSIVGIVGEGAKIFCDSMRIKYRMEFGSIYGGFEACIRGLNVKIFISSVRFRFILTSLSELSGRYPQVSYRIEYF